MKKSNLKISQKTMKNDTNDLENLSHVFAQEVDPAFAKRAEYIATQISNSKAEKILDAGCGRGFYVKLLSMLPTTKSIVGVDISHEYVKKAKRTIAGAKNATIQQGSIYNLPFKANTFDAVVCSEIMEHLDDVNQALSEIRRVLKPGGTFVLSVPHENFPFLWDPLNWILMRFFNTHVNKNIWWLAGIWADHERLYTKISLQTAVKKHFSITHSDEFIRWCWPFTHFWLYAVGKNLVERAGAKEFSRFNFTEKRPFSAFLASFMKAPSNLLDSKFPINTSMNLVMTATKTAVNEKRATTKAKRALKKSPLH